MTSTGAATSSSTSGNHFEDSLTITNNGTVYFNMGSSGEDIYDGPVILYNYSSKEIRLAATDTSYFNNHVSVNASSGGVEFGASGGVSILASGKTISVGTFSSSYLTLTKFIQLGITAQTLTLSGTGVVSLEGCVFNGNLTINAPGILTKTSTYNGNTTFNRTGSATNFHSYGSNVYAGNVTWDNAGNVGRIRLASTAADTYLGHATFSSSGGQDMQVAYVGDNAFSGNITITSNKVVFNTSTGKVTFTGTNNQTLNGSYNYPFKKLAINKTAGTVTANTTLSVDDSLIFIQGNLITTSTNLLTMKHGSTATGASNSSFVSGPVKKIGNTAFVFNVGSGTTYRPLTITAPSNTSDAFTAEYYNTGQTLGNTKDTTITFVSDCGYWKLDRNVGSSNITPKFAFDSLHCDYLTVKPVHISLWNGTKWTDKGEAVTESTNKTTSSAMTSYGYFAFAYDLKSGDAPQMPYPLTIGSTCSYVELQFTSNDIWFSFTPDSAVVKGSFTSPDTSKTYAFIKSTVIYEAYQVGDTLQSVSMKTWPFDSMLVEFQNYVVDLTPSTDYLMKVSKFDVTEGSGIYDSINYYINMCLFNLRMQMSPTFRPYSDLTTLVDILGTVDSPNGLTRGGDVVLPCSTGLSIDLTSLTSPLLVEEGVTFCGDYDILSESFDVSIPGTTTTVTTSPTGTLILNSERRGEWIFPPLSNAGLQPEGYSFYMMPGSIIRNIRLKGPMPGFLDYNFDIQLSAGINVIGENDQSTHFLYKILNCEIYNFSFAGVYVDAGCDEVEISNCQIHHIKGEGGRTAPKGYGTWIKGKDDNQVGSIVNLNQNIFDDCKTAIDLDSDFTHLTVENGSFGRIFFEETINNHQNGQNYNNHPFMPGSSCNFFTKVSTTCSTQVCSSNYNIQGKLGTGNISIKNSLFYQPPGINNELTQIALAYRYNTAITTFPKLYQIEISNNTFAMTQASPDKYEMAACNLGGYARIADNYIESCTWDYERTRDVNHAEIVISNNPPILINAPNSFGYQNGVPVASGMPQPPEIKVSVPYAFGVVAGFNNNSPEIPYIQQNSSDIDITCEEITSTTAQPLAYLIRPHPNNGGISGQNTSSENSYNLGEIVTGISTTPQTVIYTSPSQWNLSRPGLYGIDVAAIQGDPSSEKHLSDWHHQPLIIKPTNEHILTFNIKDSYLHELNGVSLPPQVYKQVELNGHPIWRELISEGGDDWEYVMINIDTDTYGSDQIKDFLNTTTFQNEITFSIAMDAPSSVLTTGSADALKGVKVWVDDVYLKKYQSAQNLIIDGDVENSVASSLPVAPTSDCIWYVKNQVTFNAYHLDYSTNDTGPVIPDLLALTTARLGALERKSGNKAIQLSIPPLKSSGSLSGTVATNYGVTLHAGSLGANGEFISAAVNFDIRDFYSCDAVATILGGYTKIYTAPTSTVTNQKLLIENSLTLSTNLTIESSDLLFKSTTPPSPPITITVPNGKTLTITGDLTYGATTLLGCKMWGGINVEPGGILIINGHTSNNINHFVTIEDSYLAVNAQGDGIITSDEPVVNLEGVKFNKNLTSLQLKNDNFNDSKIKGCFFSCDGGYISKDPSIPFLFPDAHVYLENVIYNSNDAMFTIIGNKYCIFKDAYIGIHALESDIKLEYCEFVDLVKDANPHLKGTGIVASNLVPMAKAIDIFRAKFNRLLQGISSTGNYNISIDNNNLDYFREIDDIAISINSLNFNNDVSITKIQNFLKCNIGIKISGSNLNDVTISDNFFTNSHFIETSTSSFHNTAITVQMPFTTARLSTNLEVFGNFITDYRIGIHCRNIYNVSIGSNPLLSAPNMINFNQTSFNDHHRGIWVENSNGAKIQDNDIYQISNGHPGIYTVEGITMDNCKNAVLTSNNLNELYSPIRLKGSCIGSELHCNTIDNSIYESGNGVNVDGADVSQQGVDFTGTSLDETWDNIWLGYSSSVKGIVGTPGQQFNWYFDLGLLNGDPFPAPLSANPQGLNPDNSDGCVLNLAPAVYERDSQFGKIAEDSLEYSNYEEVFKYNIRQHLYHLIDTDTTLLTWSTSKDTSFRSFYDRTKQSNINLFDRVDSLISVNSLDAAGDLNNAIEDTTTIESNLKIFYELLISTVFRDSILNSTDSSAIESIAIQHSCEGGIGVFWARALLFLEIHDNIVSSRMGQTNNSDFQTNNSNETQIELILMPNPADDECTIKINGAKNDCYLSINNMLGENVLVRKIESGINSLILNTKFLQPGVYLVAATDGNTFLKNAKLIISR
ncbi:MAG: hypothetical protein IPN13_05555 [Bacteroidetes bacterium]|nr:hypothetical protein [Bacteroidota bacterium]